MLNINEIGIKLQEYINSGLLRKITLSSPLLKENEYNKVLLDVKKDKIGELFFQFSLYFENKVKHENYKESSSCYNRLFDLFEKGYKQTDIILFGENIKILTNKNKQYKIITSKKNIKDNIAIQEHNREKNYILNEGQPIDWLVSLGIMDNNGIIVKKYKNKFKQINKFLEIIDIVIDYIPHDGEVIDVGCGKSYLSFALYYYLNKVKGKNVTITGLDLKTDVIEMCNRLSQTFGFERLKFINENIETYRHYKENVDMVITLHACDTATDYGIYGGIKWGANVILSVPCCQHEIFKQISNDELKPILKHGILKERFSALVTDAARGELLEIMGYKTNIMEFIDMEHTPKNIMIKAIKKKNYERENYSILNFLEFKNKFNINPKLYVLLENLIK